MNLYTSDASNIKLTVVTAINHNAMPVVEASERIKDVEMKFKLGTVLLLFDTGQVFVQIFMNVLVKRFRC